MMKKFLCIILALMLTLALAGCSGEGETVEVTIPEMTEEPAKESSSSEEDEALFPDDVTEIFSPDGVEITFGDIPEDALEEDGSGDEAVNIPVEEGDEAVFEAAEAEPAYEDWVEGALARINKDRAAAGCGPLELNDELMECALYRAEEITIEFSHTRTNGESGLDISGLAYAENIAMGTDMNAAAALDAWMASDGHRANMLNGDYTILGMACCEGEDGMYWVQLFGY